MLDTYSKEELKEVSMLEIAFHILKGNKKPTPFTQLMEQVSKMRSLSAEEQKQRVAQFYTDINIDGRFVCMGDNQWGLKVWYPVESTEEELSTTIKPKKRKKAKAKLDEDFDDFDDDLDEDFDDDVEDDFDDEDEDAVDEDFDDFEEEDLSDDDTEDDFEEEEEDEEDKEDK